MSVEVGLERIVPAADLLGGAQFAAQAGAGGDPR
jgi:hypothetical protein